LGFLNSSEEKAKGEYETWKEIVILSKVGNTLRMGKSFDTTKGSWITQELRRITLNKIKEINSNFLNKTQLVSLIKNSRAYI